MLKLRAVLPALAFALAIPAAAQTTVVFQDVGPERDAFNKEVVRQFEELHPDIKVDYRWLANEPYKTGIKVMLESNSPPDVFFTWAGSFTNDFADSGGAMDLLGDYESGEGWAATANPALVDQFRYRGGLYGVPAEIYTKWFWKNDRFFAEHELEVPETISDTVKMCRAVRSIDRRMTPISFGGSESWTINHYLTVMFARHVPKEVLASDYQGRTADERIFTHPGYKAALRDMRRLQEANCFNRGVNSVDPGVSRTMFAVDLAATTFCGSWCPPVFDAEGFSGRYSPFAFPKANNGAGDQDAALVGVQGYQVAAKTQVKDEALMFLDFLLSPDTQATMARMAGQLPANANGLKAGDLPDVSLGLLDLVSETPSAVPPSNTILETSVADVKLKSGQDFIATTIDEHVFMVRMRNAALKAKRRRGGGA